MRLLKALPSLPPIRPRMAAIAVVTAAAAIFTTATMAAPVTPEELQAHLVEYLSGDHPDRDLRKVVDEQGTELTALDRIKLSEADIAACATVREALAAKQAAWDEENAAALEEAYAKTRHYRFLAGEENQKLYKEWHTRKCKLAQARPDSTAEEFVAVLSPEAVVAFQKEVEIMKFWYRGHGERGRMIQLLAVGVPAEEAIALQQQFGEKMKDARARIREGEDIEAPSWKALVDQKKAEYQDAASEKSPDTPTPSQ